jgi:hypothetical protein
VTDVSVRGRIDGWEVARRAREIDPEFPIVYMSGTSAADWPSKGVPNSIMLAKPFARAQLVTAVSQLLNAGSRRPPQRSKPPQLAALFHFGLKVSLLPNAAFPPGVLGVDLRSFECPVCDHDTRH